MYIPEFWCGVAATVLTEIIAYISLAVIVAAKDNKKK